jgi:hippurate hydrolase
MRPLGFLLGSLSFLSFALPLSAAENVLAARVSSLIGKEWPDLFQLYQHLHAHPELSFQEARTSERIAEELRRAGFDVTANVGGHGVVGILKNGDGPTLMIRTDLDALPVKEQTGLAYSSRARTTDDKGAEVDLMHACGHDVHMTSFIGTARTLANLHLRDHWRGTLVMIGQPAEERGSGARAMLRDGLYARFPQPDFALALHVGADLPAGTVATIEGFALANVDTMDITVRGVGSHGAWPHLGKDPIVLASQLVLALQTIVSRETRPGEAAVVTVGSIHGGTKHNIIPDEVKLQLTLRSYSDEVRTNTIASVRRLARGLGEAAGLPAEKLPEVKVSEEFTPALFNHESLTRRVTGALRHWLGEGRVLTAKPVMGGEDFSEFGRTEHKVPVCMIWLGTVTPDVLRESLRASKTLPSLHSPFFRPDPEPTIKTGVTAMTAAALDLLNKATRRE